MGTWLEGFGRFRWELWVQIEAIFLIGLGCHLAACANLGKTLACLLQKLPEGRRGAEGGNRNSRGVGWIERVIMSCLLDWR